MLRETTQNSNQHLFWKINLKHGMQHGKMAPDGKNELRIPGSGTMRQITKNGNESYD
jgi:hypothetical protein